VSIYADMPNKDIADKIVNLWGLINENAHAQYAARKQGDETELARLQQEEYTFHLRISNLGLELAKKIIAESSSKCLECDGTGISMLSPVKPNSYIKCPKCNGTGVVNA
jgi:DnaJ-class molecular chaperone